MSKVYYKLGLTEEGNSRNWHKIDKYDLYISLYITIYTYYLYCFIEQYILFLLENGPLYSIQNHSFFIEMCQNTYIM